jgi:hypothetical protein
MTGPSGGPQGMDARGVVARVRGLVAAEPAPGPADGEIVLGAVVLEIIDGVTRSVIRLSSDGHAMLAPSGAEG